MHCTMTLFFSACNLNKICSAKNWQLEQKTAIFTYQNWALAALLFVDKLPYMKNPYYYIISFTERCFKKGTCLRDSNQYCFWTPKWVGIQRCMVSNQY